MVRSTKPSARSPNLLSIQTTVCIKQGAASSSRIRPTVFQAIFGWCREYQDPVTQSDPFFAKLHTVVYCTFSRAVLQDEEHESIDRKQHSGKFYASLSAQLPLAGVQGKMCCPDLANGPRLGISPLRDLFLKRTI